MTAPGSLVIKSTSDLTPDKILGYAKGIVATIGGILTVVNEQLVDDNWKYKGYLTAAIALCTIIATVLVPNAVKPVTVPPPATNVDPTADAAAPTTLLGTVNPPGERQAPE